MHAMLVTVLEHTVGTVLLYQLWKWSSWVNTTLLCTVSISLFMLVPALRIMLLKQQSVVCVDCLWRLLMPCSVKKVSALLRHSQVDPAGPVLVALLGCLHWVVGWDCKPETNNSSMKVTGPSSAWSRGNNSKFQSQVTVSSTVIVWCSRADKSGCRLVYFQGRGRARSSLSPLPCTHLCALFSFSTFVLTSLL